MPAYQYTLADAQADIGIKNVSGYCSDTEQFIWQVNTVTERLIKRGNWFSTEQLGQFVIYGCDVVFPRFVGTVLGVRFCCDDFSQIQNNWFAIIGPTSCHNWTSTATLRDNGMVPCFNQITSNTGKFIRYCVVKQQDYNKNITLYGKQYGAQPLQELDPDENWISGLTLTSANPFAQSTTLVTEITSVTREATQGMAYLYQYDPTTTDLIMLAIYEPSETRPRYRRMKIIQPHGGRGGIVDSYGRCERHLEVMFKLQFIPVVAANDFLLISDFAALKLGIQALKREDAGDFSGAEKYWLSSLRELNFEDRNRSPGNQFVTKNFSLGSDRVIRNPY